MFLSVARRRVDADDPREKGSYFHGSLEVTG